MAVIVRDRDEPRLACHTTSLVRRSKSFITADTIRSIHTKRKDIYMSTEKKPQTIESLQFAAKEANYKWALAMTALVFAVLGAVGGYFLSINAFSQNKIVNSIELSVKKDQ